jgi:hypothetical protein
MVNINNPLQTRKKSNVTPNDMGNAIFLTADNATRSRINSIYSHECSASSDFEPVSFLAHDVLKNGQAPSSALKVELLALPDSPTIPPGVLHLVPGMQVMILENLYPNLLITNGSIGTVVLCSEPTAILSDAFIGVLFPWLRDAGVQFDNLPLGTLLFKPRTLQFTHKSTLHGSIDIHRTQFPMTIAKALTVHKYQGQTARNGAVVCYCSQFKIDMLCVALSRVQSLSKLTIDGPLDFATLTRPWSTALKSHIRALKHIQLSTLRRAQTLFQVDYDTALLAEELELEMNENGSVS